MIASDDCEFFIQYRYTKNEIRMILLTDLFRLAQRYVVRHPQCTKGDLNAEIDRIIEVKFRDEEIEDEAHIDRHIRTMISKLISTPRFRYRIPGPTYDRGTFSFTEMRKGRPTAIHRDNPRDINWMTTYTLRSLCASLSLPTRRSGSDMIASIAHLCRRARRVSN